MTCRKPLETKLFVLFQKKKNVSNSFASCCTGLFCVTTDATELLCSAEEQQTLIINVLSINRNLKMKQTLIY